MRKGIKSMISSWKPSEYQISISNWHVVELYFEMKLLVILAVIFVIFDIFATAQISPPRLPPRPETGHRHHPNPNQSNSTAPAWPAPPKTSSG